MYERSVVLSLWCCLLGMLNETDILYCNRLHKPLAQMHLQDFFFPAQFGSVSLNCRCHPLTSESFNLLYIHMNIHIHLYVYTLERDKCTCALIPIYAIRLRIHKSH